MSKRRRVDLDSATADQPRKAAKSNGILKKTPFTSHASLPATSPVTGYPAANDRKTSDSQIERADLSIQIVTGSYERILHGFVATFPITSLAPNEANIRAEDNGVNQAEITFSDTFLFAAHASSIRSLAISPRSEASDSKRFLATGSSDERINLYQISSSAPPTSSGPKPDSSVLSTAMSSIAENPRNRELGSLLHHSRAVTRLVYPTKGKLFSAAEDNTIAITRVRDWTMLSSIKAPIPGAAGRPSGDTAAPGEVPAGVNDFAIHPSMKLMISVGKGERCMRLWNLVTGKKAGVLNFDRTVLAQIGEGRYSTGEGRKVLWSQDGERFVVLFERGAIVYNMDSEPIAVVKPSPTSKVHQAKFVPGAEDILALSTEDGRVAFFDLAGLDSRDQDTSDAKTEELPSCRCVAQIFNPSSSSAGRVKDFDILSLPSSLVSNDRSTLVCVTASSDSAVRIWSIDRAALIAQESLNGAKSDDTPKSVGSLLGTKESGNRLTCLTAFVMDPAQPAKEVSSPTELNAGVNSDNDSSEDE